GDADDGGRQRAEQLADLPLVGHESQHERAQAEQADAGEPGAQAYADAAALFRRERRRLRVLGSRRHGLDGNSAHFSSSSSGDDAGAAEPKTPAPAMSGASVMRKP